MTKISNLSLAALIAAFPAAANAATNTLTFNVTLDSCGGIVCNQRFQQTFTFSDGWQEGSWNKDTAGNYTYTLGYFQNPTTAPTPNATSIYNAVGLDGSPGTVSAFGVVDRGGIPPTQLGEQVYSGLSFRSSQYKSLGNSTYAEYSMSINGKVPVDEVNRINYASAIDRIVAGGSFVFKEIGSQYTYPVSTLKYTVLKSVEYSGSAYISNFNGTSFTSTIPAVPEPETYAMLLAGLGLMGVVARRRSKTAKKV